MKNDELLLHAKDKKVQRMTKDGLVEDNLSSGTTEHISGREKELSFENKSEDMEFRSGASKRREGGGNKKKYYRNRKESKDTSDTAGQTGKPEHIQKLDDKAEKADEKVSRAKQKLRKKKVIKHQRLYDEKTGKTTHRLYFEDEIKGRKSIPGRVADSGMSKAGLVASGMVHGKVHEDGDENYAVESAHAMETTAEGGIRTVNHFKERHEAHQLKKVSKLENDAEKVHVKLKFEKTAEEYPEIKRSMSKKIQQKRQIKKEYQKAQRTARSGTKAAGSAGRSAGKSAGTAKEKVEKFIAKHKGVFAVVGVCVLLLILTSSVLSSCGAMVSTGGGAITTSTYLSTDDDITNTNNAYSELEADLQAEIDAIETTYPGYDEYRYNLDEIDHDPYALTSYLTARYGNYTEADVAGYLQELFEAQYELMITEVVETRTRTETRTGYNTITNADGSTTTEEYEYEVEVEYDYYILNVTLTNQGLDAVVRPLLNTKQLREYEIYQYTKGNRSYLFGDAVSGNVSGGGISYEIPPEALEDADFCAMITEAEKYLGYPYVWGGSSPATSFDCSGFVCWVINHSIGNVGRTTANGLLGKCTYVSPEDAKPGDLVFFEGTYNTSGASHVGIYVGNGMMIHCGNPIQYASIETNYWQSHFLCFGRLH